ncbi:MAG: sigma-E processing peptidase SpoIIGA [Clostridia bacterium]|nr:sigma-E processing peptidase SpoIIGA [Clostridia bacterium]
MIVYGDLLFLINFSMDFLCFYLSCLLLHRKMNTFRCVLASAVGGTYSVAALFLNAKGITAFIIDLLVLIFMCVLAYGIRKNGFWGFVKAVFLYFFVSALLGGMMTALFSLFNNMDVLNGVESAGEGVNVWIFALLAILGSVFTLRGGRIFKTSFSKKVVILEIENNEGVVELRALVDSGNLATEPISAKSVAFASVEKCKNILDKTLYDAIINNSYVNDATLSLKYKMRIVPTRAISGRAFLPALKFKNVTLKNGKIRKKLDVYIALLPAEALGEYDAIISNETII